ncbi:nitrate reductase, partial [Thioclava sp. BHET1]
FWTSPRIASAPGLKAVDLFRAVEAGKIRALWIIGTNPAVSMPEADRVRAAIAGCDFTVVSEVTGQSDTARLADVLLPARAWGEKDGTVTNSERMISRQRAFLSSPGEARPDWWILAEVARRMGWAEAFAFDGPAAVFREHAALSGIAGAFGKDFDISALAAISDADYAAMAPVQWPVSAARSGGRFFGDGRFFTPDGRGRMLPLVARGPVAGVGGAHPFRLNTGRLRDQWHTMTRSGKSPRLASHAVEPCVEIHPGDAAALGLAEGQLARLENDAGRAVLRVQLAPGQRRGEVFAPMHWTGETGPTGRIDALIAGAVDPISGQPESKAAAVALRPFAAGWYGFAVSRAPARPDCAYWARARLVEGWRYELVGEAAPADWIGYARALFALDPI